MRLVSFAASGDIAYSSTILPLLPGGTGEAEISGTGVLRNPVTAEE